MPTYDIYNEKTGETKEVFCSYNDKEKTLKEEGPDWEYQITAPGLSYEGAVGPIKRAGTEWNDVLKGIKKASGKDCTIEHY
jgi:predicted nucleic acid-binding Zn ribbon protein